MENFRIDQAKIQRIVGERREEREEYISETFKSSNDVNKLKDKYKINKLTHTIQNESSHYLT